LGIRFLSTFIVTRAIARIGGKMLKSVFAAASVVLATNAPLSAATFEWSYVIGGSGETLAGFFEAQETTPGMLEVTSVFDVTLDGAMTPAITSIGRAALAAFGGGVGTPTLATDLSFIDVNVCSANSLSPCGEGFLFYIDDSVPIDRFDSSGAFSGIRDEPTNIGSFSIIDVSVPVPPADPMPGGGVNPGTPSVPPVPLPAAGWLLIAGLSGALSLKRLRQS